MHDVDEKPYHLIRLFAPTVHLRTSPDETLMHDIMATAGRPARVHPRRRWFVAGAAVAGLAAAAFAVFAALPSSSPVGGPLPASALSITETGGYLVVTVKDPAADPARFAAELESRGLDITITLAPAGPEDVGKVVFEEVGEPGKLSYIEDPGRCTSNGSCTVGVKVPLDFTSYARITFGRTPLPGEQVEGGTPSGGDAETDALRGKTVAEARTIVAAKGKNLLYRVGGCSEEPADKVPGTWKIYDAAYGTDNNIIIWVSADGTPPSEPDRGDSGATSGISRCPAVGNGN